MPASAGMTALLAPSSLTYQAKGVTGQRKIAYEKDNFCH